MMKADHQDELVTRQSQRVHRRTDEDGMNVKDHPVMRQHTQTREVDNDVRANEPLATRMMQVLIEMRARRLVQHNHSKADGGDDASREYLLLEPVKGGYTRI